MIVMGTANIVMLEVDFLALFFGRYHPVQLIAQNRSHVTDRRGADFNRSLASRIKPVLAKFFCQPFQHVVQAIALFVGFGVVQKLSHKLPHMVSDLLGPGQCLVGLPQTVITVRGFHMLRHGNFSDTKLPRMAGYPPTPRQHLQCRRGNS